MIALFVIAVVLLVVLILIVSTLTTNVGRVADAIEAQNGHYGIAADVVAELEAKRAA